MQQEPHHSQGTRRVGGRFSRAKTRIRAESEQCVLFFFSNNFPLRFLGETCPSPFDEAPNKQPIAERHFSSYTIHHLSRFFIHFSCFFLYKNKVISHSCSPIKSVLQSEMNNRYCTKTDFSFFFIRKKNERHAVQPLRGRPTQTK